MQLRASDRQATRCSGALWDRQGDAINAVLAAAGYSKNIEVSEVSETDDTECYRIKPVFRTPDGEVVRKVKVCEVVDADQQ